ncbi:MAG: RNA polymerase sigma factor [Bacteroidales bacterium]
MDRAELDIALLKLQPELLTWCGHLCRWDYYNMHDVCQCTLLAAMEGCSRFDGQNLRAWLYQIAKAKAGQLWRAIGKSADLTADIEETLVDLPPEYEVRPRYYAGTKKVRSSNPSGINPMTTRRINKVMKSLPEKDRELLRLLQSGLTYNEIAELKKKAYGAVRNDICCARRIVRNRLAYYGIRIADVSGLKLA